MYISIARIYLGMLHTGEGQHIPHFIPTPLLSNATMQLEFHGVSGTVNQHLLYIIIGSAFCTKCTAYC